MAAPHRHHVHDKVLVGAAVVFDLGH